MAWWYEGEFRYDSPGFLMKYLKGMKSNLALFWLYQIYQHNAEASMKFGVHGHEQHIEQMISACI